MKRKTDYTLEKLPSPMFILFLVWALYASYMMGRLGSKEIVDRFFYVTAVYFIFLIVVYGYKGIKYIKKQKIKKRSLF